MLVIPLLLVRPSPSGAHAVGISRGEYRLDGTRLRVDLVFARKELATALPAIDGDGDGELSGDEVPGAGGAIAAWLRRGLDVRADTGPCTGDFEALRATEEDGAAVAVVYRCPPDGRTVAVRLGVLTDLTIGHRHLAASASGSHAVLYLGQPELTLAVDSGGARPSLFRLGLVHVLTGYDHLLFLLAVVLVGGRRRSVLVAVAAFMLAHSLTLAIAALGMWTPRPTLVAPAAALSIAYVGVENWLGVDARRRWRRSFAFGLVHGFGLAGAIGEAAASAVRQPVAIASFHLGVEAGQLAVVAAMLATLSLLGRHAWLLRGGNVALAAIGVVWFVARVAG